MKNIFIFIFALFAGIFVSCEKAQEEQEEKPIDEDDIPHYYVVNMKITSWYYPYKELEDWKDTIYSTRNIIKDLGYLCSEKIEEKNGNYPYLDIDSKFSFWREEDITQSDEKSYWVVNMRVSLRAAHPTYNIVNCTDTVYGTEYDIKYGRENCSEKIMYAINNNSQSQYLGTLHYNNKGYNWTFKYSPMK